MIVRLFKAKMPDDVDSLRLEPENDDDQRTLQRLMKFYRVIGFGREAGSDRIIYAQVLLTRIEI